MKPWEETFRGYTWQDMPGDDHDLQKLNFYLFRIGRLDVQEARIEAGEEVAESEDAPRKRVKLVSVEQRRFGTIGSLASSPQRKVERAQEEAARRARAVEREALMQRRARVKAALMPYVQDRGAVCRVAEMIGMDECVVRRFVRLDAGGGAEFLDKVEGLLARLAAGECELERKQRKSGRKSEDAPAGYVPLRLWIESEARRREMTISRLRMRMYRGAEPWPAGLLRVNARCVYVPVAMESGVAA